MLYLTYTLSLPLSRFIVSFWYGEFIPHHLFERILPTGDIDLIINLRDGRLRVYESGDLRNPERFTGPIVAGPQSRHFAIDTLQQSSILGVQFRPGGAYPFLGEAADHLHNRHVALEDLWGRAATELQARLMDAPTHEARFRLLEQALLNRLTNRVRRHPAVAAAVSTFMAQQGNSAVTALALEFGLSARRFIELFRREVGVPPKTFCRILRFQGALQRIAVASSPNFVRLALDCGYYDQAHLIHDFKDFTGLTPTAYLEARGEHLNHVPLTEMGQIFTRPAADLSGSMSAVRAEAVRRDVPGPSIL